MLRLPLVAQVFLVIAILMGEGLYMVLKVLVSCECSRVAAAAQLYHAARTC